MDLKGRLLVLTNRGLVQDQGLTNLGIVRRHVQGQGQGQDQNLNQDRRRVQDQGLNPTQVRRHVQGQDQNPTQLLGLDRRLILIKCPKSQHKILKKSLIGQHLNLNSIKMR